MLIILQPYLRCGLNPERRSFLHADAASLSLSLAGLFGEKIQKAMPHCCSLSDFIGYRFGPVLKIFVVLICLFNMSIAMLAEYTTIGSLFQVPFATSCTYFRDGG